MDRTQGADVDVNHCGGCVCCNDSMSRRRRRRFKGTLDILLLEYVMLSGTHTAKQGKNQKKLQRVCVHSIRNARNFITTYAVTTTRKKRNERLNKMYHKADPC